MWGEQDHDLKSPQRASVLMQVWHELLQKSDGLFQKFNELFIDDGQSLCYDRSQTSSVRNNWKDKPQTSPTVFERNAFAHSTI